MCVLLDKPERREVDVNPEFVGFEIPDEFVVGYGLDYAELYRNLPYIGVLKPSLTGVKARVNVTGGLKGIGRSGERVESEWIPLTPRATTWSWSSILARNTSQLIARRVRECNVYCELWPHTVPVEEFRRQRRQGVILSGGPGRASVDKCIGQAPDYSQRGSLSWASRCLASAPGCSHGQELGGEVRLRESAGVRAKRGSRLLADSDDRLEGDPRAWRRRLRREDGRQSAGMSHGDSVVSVLPSGV